CRRRRHRDWRYRSSILRVWAWISIGPRVCWRLPAQYRKALNLIRLLRCLPCGPAISKGELSMFDTMTHDIGAVRFDTPATAAELRSWLQRPTEELLQAAAHIRDQSFGHQVSYSRKVFIPLTELCRDVCHYCTFAKVP